VCRAQHRSRHPKGTNRAQHALAKSTINLGSVGVRSKMDVQLPKTVSEQLLMCTTLLASFAQLTAP